MIRILLSSAFLWLVSPAIAQKIHFIEQVGIGANASMSGNTSFVVDNRPGFSFESIGDIILHDQIGLGIGFDINTVRLNQVNESVSPIFADLKFIARGKMRPYLVADPGYCLYYQSASNGVTQKGSFYMGGGAGLWLPSKSFLHLFVQGKYNYISVQSTTKGLPGSSTGSINVFNFLIGVKF